MSPLGGDPAAARRLGKHRRVLCRTQVSLCQNFNIAYFFGMTPKFYLSGGAISCIVDVPARSIALSVCKIIDLVWGIHEAIRGPQRPFRPAGEHAEPTLDGAEHQPCDAASRRSGGHGEVYPRRGISHLRATGRA